MLIIFYLHLFAITPTVGHEIVPYKVSPQLPATSRNTLLNKHLKVAAETWNPFIILYCNGIEMTFKDKCPDKDNITYGGAVSEILKLVKRARNVTFTIMRPSEYSWGDCKSPTDCDGLIGMVNRGEVDVALGRLSC